MIRFSPIFTTGRTGSTFIYSLMKDNFTVEYDEWFSPHSYNICLSAGTTVNKKDYINYICAVTAGKINGHCIKITNDICANKYWGENILKNETFISSVKTNKNCLLLLRNNILTAIISLAYSIKTNHWHSTDSDLNSDTNNRSSSFSQEEFLSSLALEYIDSELRIIEFVTTHMKRFNVLFYEDLLNSPFYFSVAATKSLVTGLDSNFKLKLPKVSKIKKEPKINQFLSRTLYDLLNTKGAPALRELYSYRNKRLTALRILENHAFYKNILVN